MISDNIQALHDEGYRMDAPNARLTGLVAVAANKYDKEKDDLSHTYDTALIVLAAHQKAFGKTSQEKTAIYNQAYNIIQEEFLKEKYGQNMNEGGMIAKVVKAMSRR